MRIILIIAGILVLVPVLLVAVLAVLLSNPDYYKEPLTDLVREQSGFEVAINGELSWRYFPPIALNVSDVEVRPAGSDEPLASLQSAEIDLAVMPLVFGGEVAVDALTFEGITVNAMVDESGKANWDTGTAETSPAQPEDPGNSEDVALSLDIDAIRFMDISVRYVDEQAGAEYLAEIERLETGTIRLEERAQVEFAASITDVAGGMNASIEGAGQLTIASGLGSVKFTNLGLNQQLQLPDMQAIDLFLTLNGSYDINGSVLDVVLNGQLDDTQIAGSATVDTSTSVTKVIADLSLGAINVDDYLGEAAATETDAPAAPAEDVEVLPIETLKTVDLEAKISIDEIAYSDYAFQSFYVETTNRSDELNANVTLDGYGGNASVRFTASTLADGAGQTSVSLSNFDIQRFTGFEWITGTLSFESNTTFTGNMLSEVLSSIDGPTTFNVANGTLDVRPIKGIAVLVDTLRGRQSSVASWPDIMPFENMNGEHRFIAGADADQQLRFALEVVSAEGTGGFDYFANTMEYDLRLTMNENEGPFSVGSGLARIEWPLHCEGALDASPADLCFPDRDAVQDVLEDVAKQELKRKGTEVLREKLGKGLKKLFGN